VEERNIDLIVAGSHRRTWADGLMHDSIAEEIFRRASVPVLVIGPHTFPTSHNAGAFRRILFATDFSAESQAATPFAVSLAEQNDAKLFVLHVLPKRKTQEVPPSEAATAAHVMHSFYETMPADVELWCRPEVTLRFGDPAPAILEAAADLRADLVVLGVRRACCGKCAHAKLPGITIARTIVAGARCPVLAVRQPETRRQIFRVNSLLNTEHRV
jgi:nucleotide-binding universal stress UspA family protein